MAEKKIEIRIAATGGDQAAAQIQQVAAATEAAADASKKMSSRDMLGGDLTQAFDTNRVKMEMAEEFDRLKASSDGAAESLENVGGAMEQNVSNIDMRIRAQSLGAIASSLGKVGDFAKSAADELREADPAMAAALDSVSNSLGRVATAAGLAAQGFAVGGPFGAAIGGLVGVALPELQEALDEMIGSLQDAAAAEQRAADMTDLHNKMVAMGPEAYADAIEAAEAYKQKTQDLTDTLNDQAEALRQRNALLDAVDDREAAERDAADAAEIKSGAAPEEVKARRVMSDAQKKIEKNQRDLELAANEYESSRSKFGQAGENVRSLLNKPNPANLDEFKAHNDELEAAADAFEKARRDFEKAGNLVTNRRRITEEKNQKINIEAGNEVDKLESQKADRLAREKQEAEDKARREEEKKQREAQRAEKEQQRQANAGRDLETDIIGLGADAADATRGLGARGINPEGFNTLAQKIARKGDPQGDQADLARMLDTLGRLIDAIPENKSGSADAQKLREVERKMERKMAQLQDQIKNLRPPNK